MQHLMSTMLITLYFQKDWLEVKLQPMYNWKELVASVSLVLVYRSQLFLSHSMISTSLNTLCE